MKIEEAINILERWHAGGYATEIDNLNPAVKLSIEALKCVKVLRIVPDKRINLELSGETKD